MYSIQNTAASVQQFHSTQGIHLTLAASSIVNYKKETSTRQHLFLEAPLKPLLDTGRR